MTAMKKSTTPASTTRHHGASCTHVSSASGRAPIAFIARGVFARFGSTGGAGIGCVCGSGRSSTCGVGARVAGFARGGAVVGNADFSTITSKPALRPMV